MLHLNTDNPATAFKKNPDKGYVLIAKPYSRDTVILRMEGNISEPKIDLNIQAEKGSEIKIVLLQNISTSADLALKITCSLKDHSHIDFIQIHLGGATVSTDITQVAEGSSSELNSDLIAFIRNKQDHHFNLTNSYNAKHGRGKILAKGVAMDESRLTINGSIEIGQSGAGTDTYLKQDCLLLGDKAKINSTPALRIGTDNVKAGHSASITNLNDESLFYMGSRGVAPDVAKKMLIKGFIMEVMDKLNDLPNVKEYIFSNL